MNTLVTQQQFSLTHSFTVFPDDLNYAGSLFGGKLLSEMDIAAATLARKLLYVTDCEAAVTVKVGQVEFLSPARLGDYVFMEVEVTRLGTTSIEMHLKVQAESMSGVVTHICEADFTFVALKAGKPHPHFLKRIK